MSDDKANNETAMLRDNEQRAAKMLYEMADAIPDAVTDSWMQTAGFSALSGTKHGQRLVREVMRAALVHIAAPIVAEQWLIKADLENRRDAVLLDVVSFFDEQIDVDLLLAEVAKAHEQDRPCTGGEPQMIDRLAHVIRTYRGMETRDGALRIDIAPVGQPVASGAHSSKQMYTHWFPGESVTDQAKRLNHEAALNELDEIRSVILSISGTFAVHKTSNVDAIQMLAKERADIHAILDEQSIKKGQLPERVRDALFELRTEITNVVKRAETAERQLDEAASEFNLIRFSLNEAGYIIGNTSVADMVRSIINEAAFVRRILRENGHLDAHPLDDVLDVVERLARATTQEEQVEPIIWPPFSSRETRVSIPLLNKLAEMIGQPHEDAPPNMTERQNASFAWLVWCR
jgi:hypothetical protein